MIINGYNMSTEIACLFLSILILFLMYFTKPRKTKIYVLDFTGFLLSIIFIVLQQWIVLQTNFPLHFNSVLFHVCCFLYYFVYSEILSMIFMYSMLITTNRNVMKRIGTKVSISAGVVFAGIAAYLCLTEQMYTVTENGGIMLSDDFYTFIYFGIIACLAIFFISFFNRKNMAKVFFYFMCVFVGTDMIFLILQLLQRDVFFVSFTYVMPLTIFYLLFHSNPYDENSGCQNAYSFQTRFMENVRYHRKYMVIYLSFPTLKSDTRILSEDEMSRFVSETYRKAEKFGAVHLYATSSATFALLVNEKDREKAKKIFCQLHDLLRDQLRVYDTKRHITYKMVGFYDNQYVKNMVQLKSIVHFLFEQLEKGHGETYYFCKEADYDAFAERYKILQTLIDIRDFTNLEDERVLCYTQPIYDIQTDSFRTAEALMRLRIDGKMIYPDQFIHLAEEYDCIHALTCIMLNKVCENVKALEPEYDFDAITVNCSTLEFSNRNLNKELIQIIQKNGVSTSKIRLELTESTMFDDYEAVLYNMKELQAQGIQFYLDDFGTGYSNLERIISCPFMTIKFDKSLLYKAVEDKSLNALLNSMVHVFKDQGFILLMEGVENDFHRDYSIDCGFDYIQGYRYAKPVPVNELISYFKKNQETAAEE